MTPTQRFLSEEVSRPSKFLMRQAYVHYKLGSLEALGQYGPQTTISPSSILANRAIPPLLKSLHKFKDRIVQEASPSIWSCHVDPLTPPSRTTGEDEFIGALAGGGFGGEASWEGLERGARHRCGVLQYE